MTSPRRHCRSRPSSELPRDLLARRDVTPAAKLIWTYAHDRERWRASKNQIFTEGLEAMARAVGVNRGTAGRAVAELVGKGLGEVTDLGVGRGRQFRTYCDGCGGWVTPARGAGGVEKLGVDAAGVEDPDVEDPGAEEAGAEPFGAESLDGNRPRSSTSRIPPLSNTGTGAQHTNTPPVVPQGDGFSLEPPKANGRSNDPRRAPAVLRVYAYWREHLSPRAAKYVDAKRARKIRQRLGEGFTVEQLEQAIRGVLRSDFHMGRDPATGGKSYRGLLTVLRDAEQVERFMELASLPMPPRGGPSGRGPVTAARPSQDLPDFDPTAQEEAHA